MKVEGPPVSHNNTRIDTNPISVLYSVIVRCLHRALCLLVFVTISLGILVSAVLCFFSRVGQLVEKRRRRRRGEEKADICLSPLDLLAN